MHIISFRYCALVIQVFEYRLLPIESLTIRADAYSVVHPDQPSLLSKREPIKGNAPVRLRSRTPIKGQ